LLRLTANGSYLADPGEDGPLHTLVEADGDRLLIPVGVADELASGEYTYEQFNIDALVRNGISDAGAEGAAAALAAEAEPDPDAEGTVAVDFSGVWPDGTAPDEIAVEWVDLGTGAVDDAFIEGGATVLELAPGDYHFAVSMVKYSVLTDIGGVIEARVDEDGGSVVFDGNGAVPIGFDLDREVTGDMGEARIFSLLPGREQEAAVGLSSFYGWTMAVVPTEMDPAGRIVGMSLRGEYTSLKGGAFAYSLFEQHVDGIPADPVFHIADEELAAVETDYQSLGVDTEMMRLNFASHPDFHAIGHEVAGTVALPSRRTEFYSADPDLVWAQLGILEGDVEGSPTGEVLHESGAMEPGSVTEETWNGGPVTAGVDLAGENILYYPRFYRNEGAGVLMTYPVLFSSGDPQEATLTFGAPGSIKLIRDGEGVNGDEERGDALVTDLALVPEGRYTLWSEATRDAPWSVLGTAATAEWEFTTAPGEEDVFLPVSVVNFDAEGIENGYAAAGEPQKVELDYATQPGAEQQACAAMTFEVSYDDGATWEPVAIDRDGNRATAELTHPEGAEFVSIRFTAADEAGNTVAHSTIRSYGLR
jgi:hypothetical protein